MTPCTWHSEVTQKDVVTFTWGHFTKEMMSELSLENSGADGQGQMVGGVGDEGWEQRHDRRTYRRAPVGDVAIRVSYPRGAVTGHETSHRWKPCNSRP